jgi:hypothetical protein
MATETTKWVQEKTTYNGQTVIVIRPIGDFLWEAPEGTLVFMPLSVEGPPGPQGPQGPPGPPPQFE